MSKDEYAQDIMNRAYYYVKGKGDEKKRILKLIDHKIFYYNHEASFFGQTGEEQQELILYVLKNLKEELNKK